MNSVPLSGVYNSWNSSNNSVSKLRNTLYGLRINYFQFFFKSLYSLFLKGMNSETLRSYRTQPAESESEIHFL